MDGILLRRTDGGAGSPAPDAPGVPIIGSLAELVPLVAASSAVP